jgi:hypothetical protein
MVKTLGLHPGGTGSNPVKVNKFSKNFNQTEIHNFLKIKRVGEMVSYMAHDQRLIVQFDYSLIKFE